MQLHRSDLKEIGQIQLLHDVRQSDCLKTDFADSRVIYLHSSHKTRLGTANRGLHQINTGRPRLAVGPLLAGVYSGQCPRLTTFTFCVYMKAQCSKKY